VYQNPSYQLFMPTVSAEVQFSALSTSHALEALKAFRLDHLSDRHPHALSEGQKRRLTIAAVMAMSPEVILLDEPTVGQDYEGLKNIVSTLNAIHLQTKNTMITITHDFRCAAALADRIIWLKDGMIHKTGGPELALEYATQLKTDNR
jgi:energy-coupling factor transporter ATP-binding protein EcfA2